MARDKNDDALRERRERERKREEEDERDREDAIAAPGGKFGSKPGAALANSGNKSASEHLADLMSRAEPLLEQVNSLYNTYFAGVEKRPPIERRQQLDQIMQTITTMGKPTAATLFKAGNIINTYNTYRDRWDRMLKQYEIGKGRRA